MSSQSSRSLIILYHFFHPDDVISARLYADIAKWAASEGWNVIAMPSVRSCHDDAARFSVHENHDGYSIHRVWRPAWLQTTTFGRLGNTICMLLAWTWRALITPRSTQECVIIGTDPPLGVLAAIPWRWFRRNAKIIHWCHDLYPHAAVAEGMIKADSLPIRMINSVVRYAYRCCHRIVDLGPCMRKLLVEARGDSQCVESRFEASTNYTITPWALVEPSQSPPVCGDVRESIFGPNCSLAILYSGNLGRAHSFEQFTALASSLRNSGAVFCFAGRGPKFDDIKTVSQQEANVRVAGFSTEAELLNRLTSADIHMVSLQANWTGCVVPSKFFGALSVGRPVLFAGRKDCAVAAWILEHQVGWIIDDSDESIDRVSKQLHELGQNPDKLSQLQSHCFEIYQQHFCKGVQLRNWRRLLDEVISSTPAQNNQV